MDWQDVAIFIVSWLGIWSAMYLGVLLRIFTNGQLCFYFISFIALEVLVAMQKNKEAQITKTTYQQGLWENKFFVFLCGELAAGACYLGIYLYHLLKK